MRQAQCPSCKTLRPSDLTTVLPFFEAQGPGTQDNRCATCRYYKIAHEKWDREGWKHSTGRWGIAQHSFTPMTDGYQYDSFYCGCRGWD